MYIKTMLFNNLELFMAYPNFKKYDPNRPTFLPPSLDELLFFKNLSFHKCALIADGMMLIIVSNYCRKIISKTQE